MGAALPGVELKVKEELGEDAHLRRGMAGAVLHLPRHEMCQRRRPLPSSLCPRRADRRAQSAHTLQAWAGDEASFDLFLHPYRLRRWAGRKAKSGKLTARGSCLVRLFALRRQARSRVSD